jgi:hypothetical protein
MQKNLLRCYGTDPVGRGTSTLARGRGEGSGDVRHARLGPRRVPLERASRPLSVFW